MSKRRLNSKKNNIAAVKLLCDYYNYFLCSQKVTCKAYYGWKQKDTLYLELVNYLQPPRREEANRLRSFLELCPDIVLQKTVSPYSWHNTYYSTYEVISIDPKLSSISTNTLDINYNAK